MGRRPVQPGRCRHWLTLALSTGRRPRATPETPLNQPRSNKTAKSCTQPEAPTLSCIRAASATAGELGRCRSPSPAKKNTASHVKTEPRNAFSRLGSLANYMGDTLSYV